MKKTIFLFFALFSATLIFSQQYYAPKQLADNTNNVMCYLVGLENSTEYPLKVDTFTYKISDCYTIANGRCFPVLDKILKDKNKFVGGVLEDIKTKKKTKIRNIKIETFGKESAIFIIEGVDFGKFITIESGKLLKVTAKYIVFCQSDSTIFKINKR